MGTDPARYLISVLTEDLDVCSTVQVQIREISILHYGLRGWAEIILNIQGPSMWYNVAVGD